MGFKEKVCIMDEDKIKRSIIRMAHEIIEVNKGIEDLVIIGIRRRGVPLGERIRNVIAESEGTAVPFGIVDITLYRDDLTLFAEHPIVHKTEIPFSIQGKKVVLVDDVLFTGRTVRAALDALLDLGRPQLIQLAVLIDRGHRELPIHADFIGKKVPTSKEENILVNLAEIDGEDRVIIEEE